MRKKANEFMAGRIPDSKKRLYIEVYIVYITMNFLVRQEVVLGQIPMVLLKIWLNIHHVSKEHMPGTHQRPEGSAQRPISLFLSVLRLWRYQAMVLSPYGI
jgi:hypothetical protein